MRHTFSRDSFIEICRFPNQAFNYGGNGFVTEIERASRALKVAFIWDHTPKPEWSSFPIVGLRRLRKLNDNNESLVKEAKSSEVWMEKLIKYHAPPKTIPLEYILHEAATIRPKSIPSSTDIWAETLVLLEKTIVEAHGRGWAEQQPQMSASERCHARGSANIW